MSPENAMQDKFDAAHAAEAEEVREALAELEAIREYLWPNQTGMPNKYRNCLVAIQARERLLTRYKARLEWLHDCSAGTTDAEGYEWGIYRVKWENGKAVEVWQTNADFSDLDAEMQREKEASA